jgi:threonine 3-dehydrogenase
MIYISDLMDGLCQFLEAPTEALSQRVYNLGAIDFTPGELADEIGKRMPLEMEYSPDYRQLIADSWPHSLDDTRARCDWGWSPKIALSSMVDIMIRDIREAKLSNNVLDQ